MPNRTATRNGHIAGNIAAANGELSFAVSSEEPYNRYDGDEVLVHTAEACDIAWLNSGNAPLLDNHNRTDGIARQMGVVTRAWIDQRRLWVTVKFSSRAEAQDLRQDILDGIVRNVSVGYEILGTKRVEGSNQYLVTSWRPKEASFVPVPADMTVGVGRSATQTTETLMPEPVPATPAQPARVMPGLMTEAERGAEFETALNDIRALASTHNIGNIGEAYIEAQVRAGTTPSIEVFRGIARSQVPAGTALRNEDVGLTRTETRRFSVLNLARSMRDGASAAEQEAARFEIEACEAAVVASGRATKGMYALPAELMRSWGDFEVDGIRSSAVRAAVSAGGNPNVQDVDHLASRFIDNLRKRLVFGQLGVTMLPGLDGDVELPGGDQNTAAAWLGTEDANAAESVPTFRKVTMSVKDVAAYTDITRRMLQQSTIGIEQYVRNQLDTAMAEAIDLAGWYGTGLTGIPRGLANTVGIGSVTFGAAVPTRDELINMDTLIGNTNQAAEPSFVSNTAMGGDLRKAKVDVGSGVFLMNRSNQLEIGNPFVRTNQITSGDVFAGVFSDMLMGMWGSLELDRSTEAKFLSGGLRLRAIQSVDFAVARVGSFVLGNDTP